MRVSLTAGIAENPMNSRTVAPLLYESAGAGAGAGSGAVAIAADSWSAV